MHLRTIAPMSDTSKSLAEQVKELTETVDVLCGQLQASQRAIFLITAKYLNGALPVPSAGLSKKLVEFAVPSGFAVKFTDGHDVAKPLIITN